MTLDLDIILFEQQELLSQRWWHLCTDPILEEAHWIQYRAVDASDALYMNYANSWFHPDLKIKVRCDILHFDIYNFSQNKVDVVESPVFPNDSPIVYSADALPYCSLPMLLEIKKASYDQRSLRSCDIYPAEAAKDARDIQRICKKLGVAVPEQYQFVKDGDILAIAQKSISLAYDK